jgi:hypothetical protein
MNWLKLLHTQPQAAEKVITKAVVGFSPAAAIRLGTLLRSGVLVPAGWAIPQPFA